LKIIDRLIQYQFWFEYGIGKFGIYIGIVNLALLIVANLTLKGLFFPMWGIIPVFFIVVISGIIFGYYLMKYNVASRLQSHANQCANPELQELLTRLRSIEAKVDALNDQEIV
jgi:hypothetical protein